MVCLYRVEHEGLPRHAVQLDDGLHLLAEDPFDTFGRGGGFEPMGGPPLRNGARVLAPSEPSKIVAIGLNYRDHAIETGKALPDEPMIFLKPSTAVIAPGAPIRIPPGVGRVDYEAELGVVIGRRAWRVPRDRARDYILGLTCVNDVTARDLQNRDMQWTRCKGFDTFAPIGPCIAVGLDAAALDLEGWLNDRRVQASNTRELIFPVDALVAFVSSVMTLLPGDVISTGTPSGIGPIQPGDRVKVKVEGVGELVNPVEAS